MRGIVLALALLWPLSGHATRIHALDRGLCHRQSARVRAVRIVVFLALMFWMGLCLGAAADDPKLPPGVTCSDVRSNVAQYGKIAAYAWARLHGYSSKQINEAKKCLR